MNQPGFHVLATTTKTSVLFVLEAFVNVRVLFVALRMQANVVGRRGRGVGISSYGWMYKTIEGTRVCGHMMMGGGLMMLYSFWCTFRSTPKNICIIQIPEQRLNLSRS